MNSILKNKFETAGNKLILLDYDGTLVELEPIPDRATPTTRLLNILRILIKKPNTEVIIISGRRHSDIDKLLGENSINIIAEHGAMIKKNDVWEKQIIDSGIWKNSMLTIFNRMTLSCPNSFVEEKEFSLTWHYRNAQLESGYAHSRELIRILEEPVRSNNLKIIDGKKIVEVINSEMDKGKAINKLLTENKYDFILSIGDDQTDEDMFGELIANNSAYTYKVGDGETLAKFRLHSVSEVLNLLEQLANNN